MVYHLRQRARAFARAGYVTAAAVCGLFAGILASLGLLALFVVVLSALAWQCATEALAAVRPRLRRFWREWLTPGAPAEDSRFAEDPATYRARLSAEFRRHPPQFITLQPGEHVRPSWTFCDESPARAARYADFAEPPAVARLTVAAWAELHAARPLALHWSARAAKSYVLARTLDALEREAWAALPWWQRLIRRKPASLRRRLSNPRARVAA